MTPFNVFRESSSSVSEVHPSRKILVVVTVGGSTNSAPIFEVCETLASRGHLIEFATLADQENLSSLYTFVSAVHIVDRAISQVENEEIYLKFSRWNNKTNHGRREIFECKKFHDSFWPGTYKGLHRVIQKCQPDLIFADYQAEAARDVAFHHHIPLATMWPQMPWLMVPQPWIPGNPWMQTRCLISENASMWDRFYEQTYMIRYLPHLIGLFMWTRRMRLAAGVKSMPPMKKKPDYLVFVNSFFGLQPARDLPPLVQLVGPILSDTWSDMDTRTEQFLQNKSRAVYVAFGTHVILSKEKLEKIIRGLALVLRHNHIDGIIWAIRDAARKQMDSSTEYPSLDEKRYKFQDLQENRHPSWLFLHHAQQRAILAHPSTKLFLSHSGASSANEGLFHGMPMLSMPVYGDQIQQSMRLASAGVALTIDKDRFAPDELSDRAETILTDPRGHFKRNVQRMQRIAHVAARRKQVAADMIEEHIYDWDLRFAFDPKDDTRDAKNVAPLNGGRGAEMSPMHLQTADARMSWVRAQNVDQGVVFLGLCLAVVLLANSIAGLTTW